MIRTNDAEDSISVRESYPNSDHMFLRILHKLIDSIVTNIVVINKSVMYKSS